MSLSVELYDGNLEGGLLAHDPEGYVGKALETVTSFHRSLVWVNLRGLVYRGFERWMKGLWKSAGRK